jgi:chitinase
MIPAPFLTHVMYSFANVKPETGTVVLTDSWADVEIHYDGDSWNDPGTNLYGNFKALYKLKQANRNLKVLLSIGGWSYREVSLFPGYADCSFVDQTLVDQNFRNLVNPSHRAEFARSAVAIVEDVGLDGYVLSELCNARN